MSSLTRRQVLAGGAGVVLARALGGPAARAVGRPRAGDVLEVTLLALRGLSQLRPSTASRRGERSGGVHHIRCAVPFDLRRSRAAIQNGLTDRNEATLGESVVVRADQDSRPGRPCAGRGGPSSR
jgi:hypothetical protein